MNTVEFLQKVAGVLDKALNGDKQGLDRENGFVLLIFPFNGPEGKRTNYVSNCERRDITIALKEIVARFEGRVQETTTQQ